MSSKALIVAIGNSLAGDDGIGEAVLEALCQMQLPPGVNLVNLSSDSLGLLNAYHGEDLVVFIDAVDLPSLEPGEVIVTKLATFAAGKSKSVHHMDPLEGITLASLTNPELALAEQYVLGVQIRSIELGEKLTPEVESAIPETIEQLQYLLEMKGIKLG